MSGDVVDFPGWVADSLPSIGSNPARFAPEQLRESGSAMWASILAHDQAVSCRCLEHLLGALDSFLNPDQVSITGQQIDGLNGWAARRSAPPLPRPCLQLRGRFEARSRETDQAHARTGNGLDFGKNRVLDVEGASGALSWISSAFIKPLRRATQAKLEACLSFGHRWTSKVAAMSGDAFGKHFADLAFRLSGSGVGGPWTSQP